MSSSVYHTSKRRNIKQPSHLQLDLFSEVEADKSLPQSENCAGKSKVCTVCGKAYKTVSWNSIYCSEKCRSTGKVKVHPKTKACDQCGKLFESAYPKSIYCSEKCREKGRRKKARDYSKNGMNVHEKICKRCGKPFTTNLKVRVYCGKECSYAAQREYGGKSDTRFIIFERDCFRCIYCGASPKDDGVKLEVDHVIPFSAGGASSAANLVTSCKRCNRQKKIRHLPTGLMNEILHEIERRNRRSGLSPETVIREVDRSAR